MSFVTRRRLLSGAATAVLASTLPASFAKAVWAEAAMAALAVFNAALAMSKQGGDLEDELEAVHLKLDRIIANQELTIKSIVLLGEKLDALKKTVESIPSEVISLQIVIDSRQLAQQVTQSIDLVRRYPNDAQQSQFYRDSRTELYKQSGKLLAAVQQTNRPPALTIAAIDCLHATMLIRRHEAETKTASAPDISLLKTIADNVQASLETMAGTNGIERHLIEVREEIKKARQSMASYRLASLMPSGWGEVGSDGTATSPFETKPEFCVRNDRAHVVEKSDVEWTGDEPPARRLKSIHTWWREPVDVWHIPYSLKAYPTLAGRPIYELEQNNRSQWRRATWNRYMYSVRQTGQSQPAEVSRDPDSIVAGCVSVPFEQDGTPVMLNEVIKILDVYNALTAIECTRLVLQDRARECAAKANDTRKEIEGM